MQQQHGDYDPQQQKWFCGYWLSQEEWFDIHNYMPSILLQDNKQEGTEEPEADGTEE